MSDFLVPLNSRRAMETLHLLSHFTVYAPEDAHAAAVLLKNRYPRIFNQMTVTEFSRSAMVLEMSGSGIFEPLLFLSHVDAPPCDPIPELSESTTITVPLSRAHLISLLEALEELLEKGFRPSGDLFLCLSMDGLSGGLGASEMAEWLKKRKIHPILALDYGGYVTKESFRSFLPKNTLLAMVGISEKGEWQATLTAEELNSNGKRPAEQVLKAGASLLKSSSMPRLCAASKLMLETLGQRADHVRRIAVTHPKLFFPLISLCWRNRSVFHQFFLSERIISSYEADGNAISIPGSAKLGFRQTVLPGENTKTLRNQLRRKAKHYGTDLNFWIETPASDCAETSGACWDAVCTAIEIQFDRSLILPCLCPFPTDSRFYPGVGVYRFSPFLLTGKEALKGNCRLGEAELQTAVQFFRAMLSV